MTVGMLKEATRLLWITFADPILDGLDGWAYRLLTNGAAGTLAEGEVRITGGDQ